MESSRRKDAQEKLGLTTLKEQKQQQRAIGKELKRQHKKEKKREALENDIDYRMVKGIKTIMDDWFIDPILGFALPGIGDIFTSICTVPFIWVSLARIKSIPLTLAVIYNAMIDVMLGLIPFWIGDIIDVFNKSYKKNYRLIVGYVEDDQDIINEVRSKAFKTMIFIIIVGVIIYFLIKLTISLVQFITSSVSSLIG